MSNEKVVNVPIQSNSVRGEMLRNVMDRTVNEIYEIIVDMFGPGATDGFLTKDNLPYYTRDGKETLSTFRTDNNLANMIHIFLYQAIENQGTKVGDGSTTLGVLYTRMYKELRENPELYPNLLGLNMNRVRSLWNDFTVKMVDRINEKKHEIDDETMKSMLYTCTQDPNLTAKIYNELREPLMAGAYIIPRKSNIASDFNVTVHNRPVIKVVKQWSFRPIRKTEDRCVVYYVNGILDLAHDETFASLAKTLTYLEKDNPNSVRYNTIIFLCHGISEGTRRAIRQFEAVVRDSGWDPISCNNIAIYTMTEYRAMDSEEIEDLTTIISGEPGIGGMVNPITFETYMYRAFPPMQVFEGMTPIVELETYDCDTHIVDKIRDCFRMPYRVMFDEVEGMAIDKSLNEEALRRYQELRKRIAEEKSQIARLQLSKRLRRSFGMFIDLEVGSTLLKDSQRKFELILDAIISGSEAAQNGVLYGNSMIHAARAANEIFMEYAAEGKTEEPEAEPAMLFYRAMIDTIYDLIRNYDELDAEQKYYHSRLGDMLDDEEHYPTAYFNVLNDGDIWICKEGDDVAATPIVYAHDEEGNEIMEIRAGIVEPVEVIRAIIRSSITPIELIRTKNFHTPAPLMGNWVQ